MSVLARESEVLARAAKPKVLPKHSRAEHIKIVQRRIERAERDERVDIGVMLTPPKTYMGGFTRPRDLRVLAWSKGGQLQRRKDYQSPSPDAYVPHTVYLLEGRYPSQRGEHAPPVLEHVIGFCRESDFPQVLQRYNSDRTSKDLLEAMDTAQWPWLPRQQAEPVQWWQDAEQRRATLREIDGDNADLPLFAQAELSQDDQPQRAPLSHVDAPRSPYFAPQTSFTSQQARSFHTSARALYYSTSYVEDDVVPDFFLKHKQQRASASAETETAILGRKHEKSGLMRSLTESITSGEVIVAQRRLKAKTPVEHLVAEGHIIHPSGFVVPGPGHTSTSDFARAKERERDADGDRVVQTAAVAHSVLQSDFDQVDATTYPSSHKVPVEVREPDGTVKHPSGFVPPTPAHKFNYSVSASVVRDRNDPSGPQRARQLPPSSTGPKMGRTIHTTAVIKASEAISQFTPFPTTITSDGRSAASVKQSKVPHTKSSRTNLQPACGQIRALDPLPDPAVIRAQYLPTLGSTPFFRPLLTLTFSTRPLAEVVARLSKALPRGLTYVAAVDRDDRHYGPSYSARVRNMRLARMQGLGLDVAQLLAGARGGLLGARFAAAERGRGVDGEGFGEEVQSEKRNIGVGVGNWFGRAEELKEVFRADAVEKVGGQTWGGDGEGEAFKVYGLDDWGRRIDDASGEEIPIPEPSVARLSTSKLAEMRLEGLEAVTKTPKRVEKKA